MHDRLQRSIFAFALPLLCASCSWITKAELAERADQDGDGHEAAQFGGADCDDGDASVNPDAVEACNALDDDCDGAIDDVAMSEETIFYADLDEDGAGDPAATVVACTQPTGSVTNGLDCDDGDASLNPDAAEICDGVDNDCDGEADDSAIDGTAWYTDADEDGFGVEESRVTACEAPAGTVAQAGDCDDADAAVHPYAEEPCEDADYNCDGLNGALDDDGDGVKGCEGDCDDGDAAVSPDADEVCNTLDDDCDELIDDADPTLNTSGLTLYYPDADGDGFGDEGDEGAPFCEQPAGTVADDQDCDDADEDINPDAVEVCSTASDDDCDGGTTDCTLELIDLPLIFDGEADGERAGVSLLSGQDLDGDGRADLVVGATERYDGKGGVYVVLDVPEASSELGENVAWKGTTEGDDAGYALASGGDLDGDGYAEIAASAPGGEVVYLLSGPADAGGGLSGAEVVVSGPGGGTGFGAAMVMGDLDGDGDVDLALGAPYEAVALGLGLESANVGMAYLLAGPLSGELESEDATATFQPSAEEAQSQTGRALAVADADGDGVSEQVVSAYNPGVLGASPVPTVYVVDLSSGGALSESSAVRTFTGSADGTTGGALHAGDVDGDGTDDLLVADGDASRARLVLGPLTSAPAALASADATFSGDSGFGSAVHVLGDLDGDGIGEVLLGGANGAALWFGGGLSGALSAPDLTLSGDGSTDETGAALSSGDVDGDGAPDLFIGAPGAHSDAGAVYLLLGSGF